MNRAKAPAVRRPSAAAKTSGARPSGGVPVSGPQTGLREAAGPAPRARNLCAPKCPAVQTRVR